MNAKPFFYQETQGIRISVRPLYLEEQSQPILHHYVFAYFIRIENVSQRTVQLLTRHWYIHDSIGEDSEVAGDGVVGEQPTLQPGDVDRKSTRLNSSHTVISYAVFCLK